MANAYRVIAGPWLLWAAYWMASVRNTKPSVQSEAAASRLTHLALLAVASALLVVPAFGISLLGWRSLPDRLIVFVIGAILEALGLGWAVWARVHLGQYWTPKGGHPHSRVTRLDARDGGSRARAHLR